MIKTYFLDSNVIVRLVVRDVESQFAKAKEIFSEIEFGKARGLVSILVLDEVIWVLENYYELPRKQYIPVLEKILVIKNLKILETKKRLIENILRLMKETTIDFTDYYLAFIKGKTEIVSFDKDLEKIKP